MVRGLDVFREHFAAHAGQFVLIGGTAATLAMESAGLEFRATKDLDIVLHIEALNPVALAKTVANDLSQFLQSVAADGTYDPKSLQITATTKEILGRIAQAYGLNAPTG